MDCYPVHVFLRHWILFIFLLGWGSEAWTQSNFTYYVKKGDTLTRIASVHKVSLTELIQTNQIDPRTLLKIGQPLLIPAPKSGVTPTTNISLIPPSQKQTNVILTNLSFSTNSLQTSSNLATKPTVIDTASQTSFATNSAVSTSTNKEITHIVQPGDNLYKIGKRYGVTSEQIAQWNGISLSSILKLGQKLKIRPLNSPLPKVEPLVLEPPKAQPKPPTPVLSSQPTNVSTSATKPGPQVEPIVKVAEVVKPAPRPPVSQPEPQKPPSVISPPKREEKKEKEEKEEIVKPKPDKADSSYVFLSRIKSKIDQPKVKRGRWKYIVIHHSGTKQGSAQIFETYHRKVKRMENGLAYHFVIGNGNGSGDGQIEIGNRWMKQLQGGHLYSEYLNSIAIGICFVGDFSKQKPTAKQIAACIELVEYLKKISYSPNLKFCLHREINPRPTDCPGDRFPATLLHRRLD